MKALLLLNISLLFLICSCAGEHFDDKHLVNIGVDGGGIPSENCTDEALEALNNVTSLCDRDLSDLKDKERCISGTEAYRVDYPNVVCNLEGEVVVTEKFIEEDLSPVESENKKDYRQELIDSGIFDE